MTTQDDSSLHLFQEICNDKRRIAELKERIACLERSIKWKLELLKARQTAQNGEEESCKKAP